MGAKKKNGIGRQPSDNVRVPPAFGDKMSALAKDGGFSSVAKWLETTDFYEWVSVKHEDLLKRKLAELKAARARGKADPPGRN